MNMDQRLTTIFKKDAYIPEPDLSLRIWDTIVLKQRRVTYRKRFGFLLVSIFSVTALVPAIKGLANDFALSGFGKYVALTFSGNGVLAHSWKELLLSMAESLPVMSVALCFALLVVVLWSLKRAVQTTISHPRFA